MKLWKPLFVAPVLALGLLFVAYMLASPVAEGTREDRNTRRFFNARGNSSGGDEGIILKFRSWPAARDEIPLIQEMKNQGLEKTDELSYTKVWSFKWADRKLRDMLSTQVMCIRLEEKIDDLEDCRLLILPIPRHARTNSLSWNCLA